MIIFACILTIFQFGCNKKELTKSVSTTPTVSVFTSSFVPSNDAWIPENIVVPSWAPMTDAITTPERDDDVPLASTLEGIIDLSETVSSEWFESLTTNLEIAHRGDWMTWIAFGGPSMVERANSFPALKAVYVLAGELASRPVLSDNMNLTQALGDVCSRFVEFSADALREPRVTPDSVRFNGHRMPRQATSNLYRYMLEIGPFAHVDLVCGDEAKNLDVLALVLNHRIGRKLLEIWHSNPGMHLRREVFETQTDADLTEYLRLIYQASRATIAFGFDVEYTNDRANGRGVFRDWIIKLGVKIFESNDLFQFNPISGRYAPSTDSKQVGDVTWKYRAIGRWLALSLIQGLSIGVVFNNAFYSVLMGKRGDGWTMDDMLLEDEQIHQSLVAVSQCKMDNSCESFLLEFETFDGKNLRDPTSNIVEREAVTSANVDEYIALTLEYELYGSRRAVYRQLAEGFSEILPPIIFSNLLTTNDLAKIFKGTTEVDITTLKAIIRYFGFLPNDQVLTWFWKYIEEGGNERGMQLIHFVTGLKSLPIGGLAKLGGDPIAFHKHEYSDDNMFPKAHLCFNALELPAYPNEEELRRRVGEALVQDTLGII